MLTHNRRIIQHTSTKHKNDGDVEGSLSDGVAIVFAMPPAPATVAEGDGELHCVSWEDSRSSKGERTMKVKVESCC
jgi:hypothetical protein